MCCVKLLTNYEVQILLNRTTVLVFYSIIGQFKHVKYAIDIRLKIIRNEPMFMLFEIFLIYYSECCGTEMNI